MKVRTDYNKIAAVYARFRKPEPKIQRAIQWLQAQVAMATAGKPLVNGRRVYTSRSKKSGNKP